MRPAIHFGGERVAGDAFFDRYRRSAAALRSLGVGAGEVLAVLLRNEPALLELMLAARWVGARWCMINWHFKADEVRHILEDSGARVLVVHADLLAPIRCGIPEAVRVFAVRPAPATRQAFGIGAIEVDAEDWAAFRDRDDRPAIEAASTPGSPMLYTSGTTGRPKGIRREPATPAQLDATLQACRTALGVESGMRALISAPLYHAAPLSYVVQGALHDAELWIEPRFDAEATLRLIEAHRITHLYLVATMYQRLLRLPDAVRARCDLGSVRFVASTGSACPPDIKRRMIEWWGPVFHEAYAASELGYVTHIDSEEALRKPGSAGRALAGTTIEVRGDDGEVLGAGAVGVVYARSSATPDFSYANDDNARRALERDGLWTLGDMGYLDDEGYLFVVDRWSDMVISGGVNIYPAEIEAVLATLPGVADCAVFGVPDEEFGEALLACVQPAEGATLDAAQVQAFLRERIAGYKVPRSVEFRAELPREETGKIFKRRLREPYWLGRARRV